MKFQIFGPAAAIDELCQLVSKTADSHAVMCSSACVNSVQSCQMGVFGLCKPASLLIVSKPQKCTATVCDFCCRCERLLALSTALSILGRYLELELPCDIPAHCCSGQLRRQVAGLTLPAACCNGHASFCQQSPLPTQRRPNEPDEVSTPHNTWSQCPQQMPQL